MTQIRINQKHTIATICTWLLAIVFIYTAVSKVYDWEGTRRSLYNQVFPIWFAEALLYVIPALELVIAAMLLSKNTAKSGLLLSVILMALFTGYVGLIMTGVFGRVPCSCGGVISSLGWGEHLVFNIVLMGIGVVGLIRIRDVRCETRN
ncbi:MauE/DoxX family redox-associated membrane protein [Belliella marina]|uniref:MauE/DoxX family redox-associated membrane protein n=1 Tax=Belliella marina TaxID=1644146 RepID=A0ABW4VKC0_9BACT